ncbi:hypothetical protein [Desulfoluna spongiiphila]|uniref:hypothetical protein n=1 Tax=Desulfoluna spongiiphila TaxID=419481 RepID=UPI0012591192|nr:hypothetical protein [Desulfoluna spongiiphila]VVS94186.1 hypothetical protein DBB_37580 [Desulfoluna spongiiphila]
MKKCFLVLCLIPLCATCAFALDGTLSDFSHYRSSPFQWVYPEYFYKADIVSVKSKSDLKESVTRIEFFGLSACIPDHYVKSSQNISRKTIYYHSKNDKNEMFFLAINDEKIITNSKAAREKSKDFFSAFSSAEEFHNKVFSLTPDVIDETTPTGDLWMIHAKGMLFEDTQRIKIIKGNRFTAYARMFKKEYPRLTEDLTFFHKQLPENKFLTMGFRTHDNTPDIILSTIQ